MVPGTTELLHLYQPLKETIGKTMLEEGLKYLRYSMIQGGVEVKLRKDAAGA